MKLLSEFETIEEAQSYTYITYSDMSTSVLNACIGGYELTTLVNSLEDDQGVMLNETRKANGVFSFDESSVIGEANLAYVDSLKVTYPDYADVITAFKSAAIAHCQTVSTPYASVTTLQWNKAKGIYTSIYKTKPSDSILKISVSGCEERCQATIFGISDDYDEPQNLGKAAWGTSKFVFDLTGVKFEQLEVRFPFENVEVA